MDFIGPINHVGKRTGARYIITATYYLTIWANAALMEDFIATTTSWFLFDNVVTIFVCPKILMSDQGDHFVNQMIRVMTGEF